MKEAVYPIDDDGERGEGYPTANDIHKATGVSRGAINKALRTRDEPYGKLVEYGYVQYKYADARHASVFSLTADGANAIKAVPTWVRIDGKEYVPKEPYAMPKDDADSLDSPEFTFGVNSENGMTSSNDETNGNKEESKIQFTQFTTIWKEGGRSNRVASKSQPPPFSEIGPKSELDNHTDISDGQNEKRISNQGSTEFTSKVNTSELGESEAEVSTVDGRHDNRGSSPHTAGLSNKEAHTEEALELLDRRIDDAAMVLLEKYRSNGKRLPPDQIAHLIANDVEKLDECVRFERALVMERVKVKPREWAKQFDTITQSPCSEWWGTS